MKLVQWEKFLSYLFVGATAITLGFRLSTKEIPTSSKELNQPVQSEIVVDEFSLDETASGAYATKEMISKAHNEVWEYRGLEKQVFDNIIHNHKILEESDIHFQSELFAIPKSLSSGTYYVKNNTLCVYPTVIMLGASFDSTTYIAELHRILQHEIGHAETDIIAERLGREQYMFPIMFENPIGGDSIGGSQFIQFKSRADAYSSKLSTKQILAINESFEKNKDRLTQYIMQGMIIEGIAKYREDPDRPISPLSWNGSVNDLVSPIALTDCIYNSGHRLVKPLMDMCDTTAIKYMLLNPPTTEDFDDLQAYQEKSLQELANYSSQLTANKE